MPWTVESALSESSDWTLDEDLSGKQSEQHAWSQSRLIINPNASTEDAMSFGSSPEEFGEVPEDVSIAPELVENDADRWIVFPEAD